MDFETFSASSAPCLVGKEIIELLLQAEEVWGRVRTVHSVTAANMFPISGPHSGLVLSNNHSPINLTREEMADMFQAAGQWYRKVWEGDKDLVAPMMIFDTLHGGGASQIHTHFQVAIVALLSPTYQVPLYRCFLVVTTSANTWSTSRLPPPTTSSRGGATGRT